MKAAAGRLVSAEVLAHLTHHAQAAASAPAASWGAAPSAPQEWRHPAELGPNKLVFKYLREVWHWAPPSARRRIWSALAPVMQRTLELTVSAVRSDTSAVDVLRTVVEVERRGSLDRYRKQLDRVLRDPNCDEYLGASARLLGLLAPRAAEVVQKDRHISYGILVMAY